MAVKPHKLVNPKDPNAPLCKSCRRVGTRNAAGVCTQCLDGVEERKGKRGRPRKE